MNEYTEEQKRDALRKLVREAYKEQRGDYYNLSRSPFAPEFDPAGYQEYHLSTLFEVLKTTDALGVLRDWLEE